MRAEAASIGWEGAIGGIVSAGHKPAFTRAVTVIAGPAFRIETARIEAAKDKSPVIRATFRAIRRCAVGANSAVSDLQRRSLAPTTPGTMAIDDP